jgi:hypothetical protein
MRRRGVQARKEMFMRTITHGGRQIPELRVTDLLAEAWNTLSPYRADVRIATFMRGEMGGYPDAQRREAECSLRAVEERIREADVLLSNPAPCEQIAAELITLIYRLWADPRDDEVCADQRRWATAFVTAFSGTWVYQELFAAIRQARRSRRPDGDPLPAPLPGGGRHARIGVR